MEREVVSITPLLAVLDGVSDLVCRDQASDLDRILISTDFREGLVASVFAISDARLARMSPDQRFAIEQSLLVQTRSGLRLLDQRLVRGGIPVGIHSIKWLSLDDLNRDWGGSYDRYLRG